MAFFIREGAKDDANARRHGKAMRYNAADPQTDPAQILNQYKQTHQNDDRELLKERASMAMASYENPLHAPVYDPQVAFGAGKQSPRRHQQQVQLYQQQQQQLNHSGNNGDRSGNSVSPDGNGGDDFYHYQNQNNGGYENQNNNNNGNPAMQRSASVSDHSGTPQHLYSVPPRSNTSMSTTPTKMNSNSSGVMFGNNNNAGYAVAVPPLHLREERQLMHSKKMFHTQQQPDAFSFNNNNGNQQQQQQPALDFIRRGNGNIIAPQPLPWEEAKPKIRGAHQLPDDLLLKIANKNEALKDEQIKQMNAKFGENNFLKNFSNNPDKPVGTSKVRQEVVNDKGIGIWGFGGMGKMSEELTGGLRKNVLMGSSQQQQQQQQPPHHLPPLSSNPGSVNGSYYSNNTSVVAGDKYQDRPWAKPSDLQQQKLQNGFSDHGNTSGGNINGGGYYVTNYSLANNGSSNAIGNGRQYQPNNKQGGGGGGPLLAPLSGNNNNNSSATAAAPNNNNNNNNGNKAYNPITGTGGTGNESRNYNANGNTNLNSKHHFTDRNYSVVRGCLEHTHDNTSMDPSLRQKAERYPDPAAVRVQQQQQPVSNGGGGGSNNCGYDINNVYGNQRMAGGIQRSQNNAAAMQYGSMLASPPGAKFASRSETTNGAAFGVRN